MRAMSERDATERAEDIERARRVLTEGDSADVAAYLLGVPAEDVRRVSGGSPRGDGN
jgi:hypothetical protein